MHRSALTLVVPGNRHVPASLKQRSGNHHGGREFSFQKNQSPDPERILFILETSAWEPFCPQGSQIYPVSFGNQTKAVS